MSVIDYYIALVHKPMLQFTLIDVGAMLLAIFAAMLAIATFFTILTHNGKPK